MESSTAQFVLLLLTAGTGVGLLVYLFLNRRTVFQEESPRRASSPDAGPHAADPLTPTPVDNTVSQPSIRPNPPLLPADSTTEAVRSGQRLIMLGICLHIVVILARFGDEASLIPLFGILIGLAGIPISLLGFTRMSAGLGFSEVYIVCMCVLLFVPLVSILILLRLNSRATEKLRAHGYNVGLMGASKQV